MPIRAVPLTLGGKEWSLRFALSAWAAIEDHGYTLTSLLTRLQGDGLSMKAVQVVLWSMLREAPEPPSLAEIGSWIDGENFSTVMEAAGEAIRLGFPEARAAPNPPRGRGTGMKSSASPTARLPSSLVSSGA